MCWPARSVVCRCLSAALVCVLGAASPADAQQNAVAVQLPTFSFFSVRTTVVVPDRGGAYLGSIGRASSGSSVFGTPLMRNGAIGLQRSHAGLTVHATIHDFEAMDAQLLGQKAGAASGHGAQGATPDAIPPLLRRRIGVPVDGTVLHPAEDGRPPQPDAQRFQPPADDPSRSSLADLRRTQQQAAAEDADAAAYFQRGQRAADAGNLGAARVYFQMAARRATGPLRQAALEQLAGLGSSSAR